MTPANSEESTPAPSQESTSAHQKSSLRSIGIVSAATMLSRVLGLIRDMVFGALFSRFATDAFSIAFVLPNLLRRLLAEGILSTAFIPVFTGYEDKTEQEKREAYGAVFVMFFLVLLLVTVLGILLAPWLVHLFAPGFQASKRMFTIELTQWMFPFIFLVGITSFWVALLHIKRHFATPALGPVMLNLGIISCALSLRWLFPASQAIKAMAIGVLVGGVLQLILQIWALQKQHISIIPNWKPSHPAIREVALLMAPTLLGLGVYQLNLLISRALASLLPAGSVTYIYYSDRLMELPLGVIAVAFATVNLPTLAAKAEAQQWDDFHKTMVSGIRGVLFLCVPAAFGLFMLREPIIMTLFQRGKFSYLDTMQTVHVFAPAAFGLIFAGMLRNLTPAFYAVKDTRTPVLIAFVSLILNASLAGLLGFALGLNAMGLTLANACSTLGSVLLSLYLLQKKLPYSFFINVPKISAPLLAASGLMALALWPAVHSFSWNQIGTMARLLWLGALVAGGGAVFVIVAWLLRVEELQHFASKLTRRLRRNR